MVQHIYLALFIKKTLKRGKIKNKKKKIIYFTELLGTPIGTGTLYVMKDNLDGAAPTADDDDAEDVLQSSNYVNAEHWLHSIRNDTLYKERRLLNRATETDESLVIQYLAQGGFKKIFDINDTLFRVNSSLHAGAGPLVWGLNVKQKADVVFTFINPSKKVTVYYVNYHGGYYHYTGHCIDCPSQLQNNYPYEGKKLDSILDSFRTNYANAMSNVYPHNVTFQYHTFYECDFFHSNNEISFRYNIATDSPLTSLKFIVMAHPDCVYSKRNSHTYNIVNLINGIRMGSITGFVTLYGGEEATSNDANDFFGYCVQNYKPTHTDVSPYTRKQIEHFKNINAKKYLDKHQIGLTLNSGTFHSEETISTIYLQWLMTSRGFFNFTITHFIEYKFTLHSNDFLLPLLHQRHTAKLQKDNVSTECIKLICNGSFGYNALESSNYNTIRLMKGATLKRYGKNISAYFGLDKIKLISIITTTPLPSLDGEPKEPTYDFLYAVTITGKFNNIKNSLPKAVAILSNSKALFLNHIRILLECLDPNLAELCYIDTDSCIFSFTYSTLEECLLPTKKDFFKAQNILATPELEKGPDSYHGKLKCEGLFYGGLFRTIKIYRLYSQKDVYTRCKGVNRRQADSLPHSTFYNNDPRVNTINRKALRPTAAGEMCITHESRSIACPINVKRYVTSNGVHTLPLSLAWIVKTIEQQQQQQQY